ncbi:uncharacterized protein LOC120426704 [Culex pipiens pallens]|uniref:uncharacterized protein LOC120426704 n=1 Tax=Culex pipiens pallens TaxID=42434 RepID=UPI0019546BA1|nr:uncharacterized protein LOC120426704 [Culex pipiens pallens]
MTPKLGDAPLTNAPWRAVICFQSHACSILFVLTVFAKVLEENRIFRVEAVVLANWPHPAIGNQVAERGSSVGWSDDRTGAAPGWRNFGDFFHTFPAEKICGSSIRKSKLEIVNHFGGLFH